MPNSFPDTLASLGVACLGGPKETEAKLESLVLVLCLFEPEPLELWPFPRLLFPPAVRLLRTTCVDLCERP